MSLVLVGGTGGLGLELSKGLLTSKGFTSYKALVRPSSAEGDKAKTLTDHGWTIVPVDFTNSDALEQALVGTKVVVSTLGGNDLTATEIALIVASKKVGVQLFVPSQFAVDLDRWGYDKHPYFVGKKPVIDAAKEHNLPVLTVVTGGFSDTAIDVLTDIPNLKATLVGKESDHKKFSFTTRADIGLVLAKALEDPEYYTSGGKLSIQGSTLTLYEAVALFEKVTGKKFEIQYLTGDDALKQEKELVQKGLQGDGYALFRAFVLHLLGEPARGNDGADVSAESKTYGLTLETLEETIQKKYAS